MTKRNVWGWGAAEAAVSVEETQARVEPFFGASEVEAEVPPRLLSTLVAS